MQRKDLPSLGLKAFICVHFTSSHHELPLCKCTSHQTSFEVFATQWGGGGGVVIYDSLVVPVSLWSSL